MEVPELFLREVVSEDDPDMSRPAFSAALGGAGFYDLFWPEAWSEVREALAAPRAGERPKYGYAILPERMRGDTLISFNTVFKVRYAEGDDLPAGAWPGDVSPYLWARKKTWMEGVSPRLVECFRRQYHCLANFMPMPWGLNRWRGFTVDAATGIKNPGLRDFPDLFFDQVRKWYLGSRDVHPLAKEEFDAYRTYFDRFGEGEAGWRAYAERNYLLGSFVDEDGGSSSCSTAADAARPEPPACWTARCRRTRSRRWSSSTARSAAGSGAQACSPRRWRRASRRWRVQAPSGRRASRGLGFKPARSSSCCLLWALHGARWRRRKTGAIPPQTEGSWFDERDADRRGHALEAKGHHAAD